MSGVELAPEYIADLALPAKWEEDQQTLCSLAQQRFWVLDQLDPGNPSLNIAVRWRLEGLISTEHIERAFELILLRHDVLRTTFFEAEGEAFQRVQPASGFHVPDIDLTALPEADAVAEANRIAQLEARTPFDLAVAPLIRVTRVRLRESASILLVTAHHIACDGWSVGILAREMGEICAALQAGRTPNLTDLPVNYREYSAWQRACVSDPSSLETEFWTNALTGIKYFELPTDFHRPAVQTTNGKIQSLILDRNVTTPLIELGQRHGCTFFMTSLAVLCTVLYRYTGESDIGLGTQVAGRSQEELEPLVGPFINTLVLRNNLSGNPTFAELLERVRDFVVDALQYSEMPIARLIEILKPKRDLSRNAIFSTNFIFQRSFIKNETYGSFKLIDLPSYSAGAMYDLNFFMVERPEGWRVSCEYNTNLFEADTIDRLLGYFVSVMRAVVRDPAQRLSSLPILSDAERRSLVLDANRTASDYPRDKVLTDLIVEQVVQTPDAVAVVCGEMKLTYGELHDRSDALARHILQSGIAPGSRIGLFLHRSIDLPVALLAVLKSGSVYVPLDPLYPSQRIAQIIESSSLATVITESSLASDLAPHGVSLILLDRLTDLATPGNVPLPAVNPSDLAYIIYTSGSTGRPKGVQIEHRALVNLLWSMRAQPGLAATDILVAITTICFDIAALEIFLPLIVGAKVVIATEEEARDGTLLIELLQRHRATVMQATPATWQLLVDAGWEGNPRLRVLCGGEAMPRRLADQLLARGEEVWNLYGPTETTIWSSALQLDYGEAALGPPIANTQFYVLDALGELVPKGAPGELFIGGDGVARGYWENPANTSERFIPDRFRNDPHARLYRTGDLVRMKSDGRFEYLGRTDHQVKIRGFRIELGEVEAALLAHHAIKHAVAITRLGQSGEIALYAYIVPEEPYRAHMDVILGELRALLVQTLPAYMRPSAIIPLASLPRTPNGKIDRNALPECEGTQTKVQHSQPLDGIESRLAAMWRDVLGVEHIDRSADFFELGGHSLLAVRLIARIEAEFGRRVRLASLFRAPTVEALARLLERSDEQDFDFRLVARLQPDGANPPIFAINNTGIYHTLSKRLGPNQPLTALQLFDPLHHRQPMPESVEEIAAEYIRLIRKLQPVGPYALIGWCNGGVLAFEVARQLKEAGQEISFLGAIDTWVPGYFKRLSWLGSKLADYSYRSKLIMADWMEVREGRKSVGKFLAGRVSLKYIGYLVRLFKKQAASTVPSNADYMGAENYDRWLLQYLENVASAYEPKTYSGKLIIFKSEREPGGLFLDPEFGWGPFASGGVEVATIPGDHFSVFKEPGVQVMARHITTALATQSLAAGDRAHTQ